MKGESPKSTIDELKKNLYRRDFKDEKHSVREEFYSRAPSVPKEWQNVGAGNKQMKEETPVTPHMLKKVLVGAIIFFAAALGIAAYLFFGGGNIVSSENVGISILGPVSIAGGEELSLQVSITNKNRAPLQYTDLAVEYPEGTHAPDDIAKDLPRYRTSLGVIKSGETVNHIVRAVLFGEEHSVKQLKFSVEYRVEGSNAVFVKEEMYDVTISSAPMNLSMETLQEVNTNQEMTLRVQVHSNANFPIDNVLLRLEYPFGFEPKSAIPETTYGNNIWDIGTLKSGENVSFEVVGVMRAQDNEKRIFSAHTGIKSATNERDIATIYSSSFAEVLVKKPFIGVVLALDGNTNDENVVSPGVPAKGELIWTNNLATQITDAVIEMKIEGVAFNKNSITVDRGFYNSNTNTIIWDKTSLGELATIEQGATGRMNFSFTPRPLLSGSDTSIKNPEIRISVSARGTRASDSGAEVISESLTRTVKVNSSFQLSSRAVHYTGPFGNSGPMPPRVGQNTTYTILWSITNSSNDVSRAKVTAVLPLYVKWTGVSSSGDVSFNYGTGEITWNIGGVDAGVGTTRPAREVSFQVALTPSVSQVGQSPALINSIVLTGTDNFTNAAIRAERNSPTTNLSTDPSFNGAQAKVIE
ncbi:MAG: hypothetical protein AAB769_01935 [Patescibacteria group bacterium]